MARAARRVRNRISLIARNRAWLQHAGRLSTDVRQRPHACPLAQA